MSKLPSPCVDVCKFRLRGHCAGCSMTKAQKKLIKRLKKSADRQAFVELLVHQQSDLRREGLGSFNAWARRYAAKCRRKSCELPARIRAVLSSSR